MRQPTSTRNPQSALLSPGTLVLCGLLAAAVIWRLLVHFSAGELPWNFTPVEAMALFGGAYFADRKLAIAVPLVALFAADCFIGFYGWMMPVVYGCVALTAFAGFALRGRVRIWNTALAAIGSATGFYLVTNFFVWLGGTMYPHTASGLVASYVAGWPFYQYGSLPGTLAWTALLFGGFALLGRRWAVLRLTTAH
ncbi:MAG TPA: DUF6580 family putative transport protein [Rhodanobacteraceae bacterium]|jgi:hypothetical protein|nr:DUF6580 family putative transport protein [Rhodanobacteraceae bacterium]